MTDADPSRLSAGDLLHQELAVEQSHVDRVYAELGKASSRAALVQAEGMARARSDRTGEVREEEVSGLFERDALVFNASRRQQALERQQEGLVFGRLDLGDGPGGESGGGPDAAGGRAPARRRGGGREIRYIGRLGVRDDDYEPLVVDWRAPAAAPFYQATPVQPLGVLRRRVLRCQGARVVGAEDDLMVPEAPEDLVILGDGALMAALTRSRGAQMRDIVATIQAHQDAAIRAPARGVTEITGGPGTGKTVVALHRAAYLLYSDRRRYESGGVLVVGPSAAYTAYIERVLPSLGEESVVLRSVGDVLDVITSGRVDPPEVARIKGSLAIRQLLARAARDVAPGAPQELRAFVAGHALRLRRPELDRARAQVLRHHQRNASADAMRLALGQAAWAHVDGGDRAEFLERFHDHNDVDAFLARWWPPVDAREMLLWLADEQRATRYAAGVLSGADARLLAASLREALDTGLWSVADVALIDDLAARLGPVREVVEERGFYEVEDLDDVALEVGEVGSALSAATGRPLSAGIASGPAGAERAEDPRDRLLRGRLDKPRLYAHVLVDEAQDLSPMQWRMLGRRGRWASWTVVGDAAQASWPDQPEARAARDEAFGTRPKAYFHMSTNYRNAREIFDYAAARILADVPDADIPVAVRTTGTPPVERVVTAGRLLEAAAVAADELATAVQGAVAVVAPARWAGALSGLHGRHDGRVTVTDPRSTKGLEYDATVVIDPEAIVAESPGGVRMLYVVLTRAAHRMHVITLAEG